MIVSYSEPSAEDYEDYRGDGNYGGTGAMGGMQMFYFILENMVEHSQVFSNTWSIHRERNEK